MLDFLGNRMQKTMAKMKAKTMLSEADILQITREIKMSLLEADVNLIVVKEIIASIKEKAIGSAIVGKLNPEQQMVKIVKEELVKILGNKAQEIKITKKPFVIMMVGLQGAGKTTTAAKLVKYLMKKEGIKNPLMVAADVYRPAAVEQLKTLGKELNISVYEEGTKNKPQDIVANALKKADHDLIIIDTAGRLSINEELMQELKDIKKIVKPNEILFIADAMAGQDIINVAKTFHEKLKLTGSIITKLDSDARGGAALSIRHMLNLPIRFVGTGEKVSNLDLFHPDRTADRILGMGDVLSLIEKASDVIDEKQSRRMMNRMISGHFDLDDLMDQMRQMKKLGKMSKILKMIPGAAQKVDPNQIKSAEGKLELFEILISSMTKEERKNPKLLKSASRKERIMKGSGRSAQEYNKLINEFDRMAKQMKAMAKQMKDGSFNPGMLGL